MARATPPEASEQVTDALTLLERDHRLIERLFLEFDEAIGEQIDPVARRTCKMLTLHAKIEEEIFYPAARSVLTDPSIIDGSVAEHTNARTLITRIEALTSEHPEFQGLMEELARQITVHIGQEERELFPRLRETELNLRALGVSLLERRETLMEVMGLHEDDELRATPESPAISGRNQQRPKEWH